MAEIQCTRIVITAGWGGSAFALALFAEVQSGTGITVVTGDIGRWKKAPDLFIADIGSAWIVVGTDGGVSKA